MVRHFDDLDRDVFCVLGIPVDNIRTEQALDRIDLAIQASTPYFFATPNINFIVNAAFDGEFKKTLIFSDLCLPDGSWVVRLGRLLGAPFEERIAGADILEALKARRTGEDPVKLCFFGGSDVAGERAREAINARKDSLRCVGAINPGFGSVEDMSADNLLSAVNSTGADFLLVALGAKKGQMWLHANHGRLAPAVRAHLGAAINFYAGVIKRAPRWLQAWGLEWVWRIKEEPQLWRRYAYDGAVVALMLFSRVLPLLMWSVYLRARRQWMGERLTIGETSRRGRRVISLAGALTAANADAITASLRSAMNDDVDFVLDLSGARAVDARFAGLLWMFYKMLARRDRTAQIDGASWLIRGLLALYGFEVPQQTPEDNLLSANGVPISTPA